MLAIADLKGFDFGEPGRMDIATIYRLCRERRVALTHLMPERAELVSGSARRAYPTGVGFVYRAESIEDAQTVVYAYAVSQGNSFDS
jgi:hypothetical protein